MRGVPKPLLALATVALLIFALSACGSDDSDGTTAAAAPESTATSPSPASGNSESPSDEVQGEENDSPGASDGADSGASDERSAPFRTPGGDNSIQNFGEEPDQSEFDSADTALSGFMAARAKGDWAGMCADLAAAAAAPLEELASRAPQLKGKDCAAILQSLLSRAPASSRANTMTDGLASFRVEGERGFALYHGPKGVDYFVPMVKEDGEWKVGSLAPSEFP
jgi:hypothetical protein